MGDEDDDIGDLEDYLIQKDPPYYVNKEEERSKERRCKLLGIPYVKPPTCKSEKFEVSDQRPPNQIRRDIYLCVLGKLEQSKGGGGRSVVGVASVDVVAAWRWWQQWGGEDGDMAAGCDGVVAAAASVEGGKGGDEDGGEVVVVVAMTTAG
ncbi:hypothetical protein Tco_1541384 [Tanacetum coccineum]